MTRKDYELIAGIIRRAFMASDTGNRALDKYAQGANECAKAIARQFALELENENERFDRERFLKACGVA